MKVESVRLEGRELILTLSAPAEARKLVYKFKPGNYDLTKVTQKRSLSANSYCWILCDKIAQAVGITKEEVYRHAIREVGVYVPLSIATEKAAQFTKAWEAQGLGYQVELVGNVPTFTFVHAYYGSHLYDNKEMCRLIDYLIEDARSLDIETMPEEELQSLLSSWR